MIRRAVEDLDSRDRKGDAFGMDTRVTSVQLEGDRPVSAETTQTRGLGVRAVVDGRLGFSATTREDDVGGAVESAIGAAEFGDRVDLAFPREAAPALEEGGETATEADPRGPDLGSFTPGDLSDLGADALRKAREGMPDSHLSIGVSVSLEETHIANTSGLHQSRHRASLGFGISATRASENDILQWFTSGRFSSAPEAGAVDRIVEDFALQMEAARRVVAAPVGPTRVLIEPEVTPFIFPAVWMGLSAQSVHEGRSPFRGRLGEQVMDPRVTISDLPRTGRVAAFDDEGVPTRDVAFVREGVLERYAADLRYASVLGVEPTGSGHRVASFLEGRSFDTLPGIEPAHPAIGRGDVDEEDALRTLGNGIVISFSYDPIMGNVINGDVRGTVLVGFRVERGEVVGRVKGVSFSGNIYQWLGEQLIGLTSEPREPRSQGEALFPRILVDGVVLAG